MRPIQVDAGPSILELDKQTTYQITATQKEGKITYRIDNVLLNLATHQLPHESSQADDIVLTAKGDTEGEEEADVPGVDGRMGEAKNL